MSEQTILQNTQDTEVPLQEEDTWLSIAKYLLFELGRLWDSWLDFRLKLLVILLAWLVVNIGLIRVAWRVYGTKVTETFGNEESNEEPSADSDEVNEQNLDRQ